MISLAPPASQAAHRMLAVLMACWLALFAPAAQADEPRYFFDIPSGDAKPMLREFATQAKREIVFAIESVDRIRTRAVKGEMTAQAAIDQMLANTGLVAGHDPKTGAFAVRRERPEESKNGQRAAQKTPSDRPMSQGQPTNLTLPQLP